MTYAAIQATFSDFRLVRGRKTAVLHFEIPIEKADEALKALGGVPQTQSEVWCGIARLDLKKAASEPAPAKERRKFVDLPIATQAGIIANEPAFWRWSGTTEEHYAAMFIRQRCNVKSRADIKEGTESYAIWQDMLSDYERYKESQPF